MRDVEILSEKIVSRPAAVPVMKSEPVTSRSNILYYCPLLEPKLNKINCSFFTTKEGFIGSAAASHLSRIHESIHYYALSSHNVVL